MKNEKGFSLIELLITILALFVFVGVPLAYWSQRNLNFWLSHFQHHAVTVPFWLAYLATIVGNGFSIIANVIGEIARRSI